MALELHGVEKRFGEFSLEPVSITIEQGEFFSLLGPSGCGKTTLLRLIGGFEATTNGKIILDTRDITQLPPFKRNIHTVFQRYALFPHLNVFENVAFSLKLQKKSASEIEEKTNKVLALVEIEHLKTRSIQQISGGQAQRVALARALVNQPPVLLLDEPLSALDPALRVKMREELKNLCKKVGATFVFVTHDQEEALQLSDRMAVMKSGKCLQVGTPKAIYEDPVDNFVANFIGPINEIEAELENDTGEQYLVQSAMGSLKVKKNGKIPTKNISLLLRPEKMRLLRQKSHTQDNIIEGTIEDLCYLGSRTEYSVRLNDKVFKVFEQELDRSKKRNLNIGDKVYLSWKPEDAILLNKDQSL
jgi:spermidine/putrescine transport system ATP-binding protein